CVVPSSHTGASTQAPVGLHISLASQAPPQHTLPPPALATQAPLLHSEPELQAASRSFFGRLQLPWSSHSDVGLHSRSARRGSKFVHASATVAHWPARQRPVVTLGGS